MAIAVMNEIDAAAAARGASGRLDVLSVTQQPEHVAATAARPVAFAGGGTPHDLAAPRTGDRFTTGPLDGGSTWPRSSMARRGGSRPGAWRRVSSPSLAVAVE